MDKAKLEQAAQSAAEFGFSHAAVLDAATITLYPDVRSMCNTKACRTYGHCWTCPPACGSLEENTALMRPYTAGVIVQTTVPVKSRLDWNSMVQGGKDHVEHFRAFRKELAKTWPDMLALGAGGCSICEKCTYPDAPCRFPDEATSSMEAFGMMVNEVCKKNGLKYHYGDDSITYSACYLLEKEEAAV